jgi:WD40 repeat protein
MLGEFTASQFSGHRSSITEVALQRLAVSSSEGVSEGAAASLASTTEQVFSQYRYRVATASDDGTVRLWAKIESSFRTISCFCGFFKDTPEYLRFSPLHDETLYVTSSNCLYALDLASASLIQRTSTLQKEYECSSIDAIAISPDGALIALGDDDGSILLVDRRTLECTRVIKDVHSNLVGSLHFGLDSSLVYSGGFDSVMVQYDLSRGRSAASLDFGRLCPSGTNPAFVHSIDGICADAKNEIHEELVACALGNGEVKLIRPSDLSIRASAEASGAMISCICTSVSGLLIAASNSGKIIVYTIGIDESDGSSTMKMSASEKRRMRRGGKKHAKLPSAYTLEEVWRTEVTTDCKINTITAVDLSDETLLEAAPSDSIPEESRRRRNIRIFVATTMRDLLCYDTFII